MEDLLGALIQGSGQQSQPESEGVGGDMLAQLLQGIMGGQAPQAPVPQAPEPQAAPDPFAGQMDLGGLLQGLLGGTGGLPGSTGQAPAGYGAPAETAPAGYGAPAGMAPAAGAPDLGGLLQVLLGGAGGLTAAPSPAPAASAGGLGDILGAILGGGSSTMQSNSFLAPIINRLAEKIGLPPQLAQAVVAFVLGKLMEHRLQPGLDVTSTSTRAGSTQRQAASLEDVVQRMNSGQRVTKTGIRSAGLARELAAHTGLDRATAEASLQEVLNALGGQLHTGQ